MRDETLNSDGIHRVYSCDVQVTSIHQKSIIDEKKKIGFALLQYHLWR